MNLKRSKVKTKKATGDHIHIRERAKRLDMAAGRAPDDSVAWYCHMRISELLTEATQSEIAKKTGVPASAINLLLKQGRGVGPTTAKRFAELFGFTTRGAMVDAADDWWSKGGYQYALRQLRRIQDERYPERPPTVAKKSHKKKESATADGATERRDKRTA